jgi:hypothetical protein
MLHDPSDDDDGDGNSTARFVSWRPKDVSMSSHDRRRADRRALYGADAARRLLLREKTTPRVDSMFYVAIAMSHDDVSRLLSSHFIVTRRLGCVPGPLVTQFVRRVHEERGTCASVLCQH